MKTGSLVKRIDNWVKHNPWMKDNEEFGIVIYLPKSLSYKPCIKVLWSTIELIQ